MSSKAGLKRRDFIKISTIAGSGLLVGLYLEACSNSSVDPAKATTALPMMEPSPTPDPGVVFEPGVFVRIDGTGQVTVTIHRPDIGQGARTALAMIAADELGAAWKDVRVEQARADPIYGQQGTGGSDGISESYLLYRRVAAVARSMLVEAAAGRWGASPDTCRVEDGFVIYEPSGERFSFADLVEDAALLAPPKAFDVELRNPAEFKIIGTSKKRIDDPDFVSGSAIYGLDVMVPEMLYACVARCPVSTGEMIDFDDGNARAVDGVLDIVPISSGVAVVADSTWDAMKGRDALKITWDEGVNADLDTHGIRDDLTRVVLPEGWDPDSGDPNLLRAVYEVPFFAHATLEPMNCVADVRADRCEVWAPTQVPADARQRAASISGLTAEDVTINIPRIGGGFGRRLQVDYVEEAVEISKAVGKPVKLTWSREDDFQHDYYHPFSLHYVRARLDAPGLPLVTSETYARIPHGAWRSVTNFTEAFVRESFVDEMAHALGRDPLELRLEIEPPSMLPVLEKAALEAGWGEPLPEGWGRGIACHSTWNVSPVAQVVEVSVSDEGEVHVHRVVCVIDCGLAVNPDMVVAQMEGGIVFGLTAALKKAITISNGRVEQSNFHDYPLLAMGEMPQVEVHIMPGSNLPFGVGEMATPPIAPAVFNAIFDATGVRVRHLPVKPEDILSAK